MFDLEHVTDSGPVPPSVAFAVIWGPRPVILRLPPGSSGLEHRYVLEC